MHRIHLYNNLERRKDVSIPVYQCICDRWRRGDTVRLLARETGRSVHEVKRLVADHQTHLLYDGVERIIDRMHQSILHQDLSLPPIVYHEKADPSSHKMRTIGVESIEQQLYDEVADYALRRWMRDKRVRWAVQADVKKCYENIDRKKLMGFLRHVVKGSPRVLWLIETLISTHRHGLNIGCKLSQDLVNIYLSVLYHQLTEQVAVVQKRRGETKKHMAVCHALFQMDDILLLCTSKRDAKLAVKALLEKSAELGITIKPSWRMYELNDPSVRGEGKTFVDIIGVRFYRHRRSLRRRVYIRARRGLAKVQRLIRMHKRVPGSLAKRVISHIGCLLWTEHFRLWRKYKVTKTLRVCKEVISHESKILYTAGRR